MVPVNLVSVLASLVVLYGFYRKDIPNAYALEWVDEPNSAITDKATFTTGWVVLAALLFGFFVFEPMGVPISVIAGLGALVLLIVAYMGKKLSIMPVVKNAPWQIVIFSLGMYLVVYGLKKCGFNRLSGHVVTRA